jgi:hypothetical protein
MKRSYSFLLILISGLFLRILLPAGSLAYGQYTGGAGDGYDSAQLDHITLSIGGESGLTHVQIRPNPVRKGEPVFVYSTDQGQREISILISDLSGKQLYSTRFRSHVALPLEGLSAGIYLIRVFSGQHVDAFKLSIID